jgi:hypothetical protein
MRVEFDTNNPEDVAYVRKLLGMTEGAEASSDTPDYETFVLSRGSEPSRRPHIVAFIAQAKSTHGLSSEVQERSHRVTLKAGITPVVYVYTSGRILFRIPQGAELTPDIWDLTEGTSEADIANGWGITVYATSDKHVSAAVELAGEAKKLITT